MGQHPLTPHEIANQCSGGRCLATYRFAITKQEPMQETQDSLLKAQWRMKKYADKGRRPLEFQVGDEVLLKLTPQIWRRFRSESVHRWLIPKYDGPFEIFKRVVVVAYKLKLPERLQIHPIVHVSFLKLYHGDEQDPARNEAMCAPPTVMVQFDREVDRILDKKVRGYRKGGNMITYYIVKWKGAGETEASWEKVSTL